MWQNLSPQMQQYLMAMMMGHQGGGVQLAGDLIYPNFGHGSATDTQHSLNNIWGPQGPLPGGGIPVGPGVRTPQNPMPGNPPPQPMLPANNVSYTPGQPGMPTMAQQLSNPLMSGGNSAVNPQQQAQMMQYLQMLQSPQSWGATANGQTPMWQLLMGRSPAYGTGSAVA